MKSNIRDKNNPDLMDSTFYKDGQGKKEFLREAFSPVGHNIIKNLSKLKSIAKNKRGK